jgi:cytochrome c-type biogenesis protein CcmE
MSKKTIRVGISAAVIAGCLGLLLFQTVSESAQYYKMVDEVMVSPDQWYGKPLNLHGFVVDDSIERRRDSLDIRFRIRNGSHTVLATYTGTVPDTFKDGSEVVLTGQLTPAGFAVEPGGIMAKCPSKYEPGQPGTQPGTR